MVEFDLAKVLEDLRQDIKENNRKLDEINTNLNNKIDKLTEITQKDLTEIKVNQAKLQGKIEIVQLIIGGLILLVFTVILKVFDVFPHP